MGRDGSDVTNALTMLALDAASEIRMSDPNFCLRVHDGTPKELYRKACKMVQEGQANPAFFGEKCAISTVLHKGGTLEEAREWTILGCIEPHPGLGAPFGDNAGPAMGRDTKGPTASINSISRNIDQTWVLDGSLINMRFDPSGIQGEKGLDILESCVRQYADNNGFHIQINVVDDKTLRAAQEHPEEYRDIVVRVAGYMAYFTELDKNVQDAVIARTSHLRGA